MSAVQLPGTPQVLATVQSTDPAAAAFNWTVSDTVFNGVRDTVSYFGYNAGAGGSRPNVNEPKMALTIENHYLDRPGGTNWQESYLEYSDKSGAINLRPWFIGIDRDQTTPDAAIQRFMLSTTLLSAQRPSDQFGWIDCSVNRAGQAGSASFKFTMPADAGTGTNTIQIGTSAAGQTSQIVLQAGASQRAMTFLANAPSGGQIDVGAITGLLQFEGLAPAANRYQALVNIGGSNAFGAQLLVQSNSNNFPSYPTLVACAKTGTAQTGSLTEWQDPGNAVLSRVDRNGYFMTRKTAAPADADLATGELAIWFDQTPGAARLQIKARDAGGGIRTGSVALA